MADTWNPARYGKFEGEREAPFHDLVEGIRLAAGKRILDLGCGTGALTARLHGRFKARETLGVDNSPAMLASAPKAKGLRFETKSIEEAAPEAPYDLVFANASLQWVDDHEALLPRLAGWVAPKGQLVFQIPANHAHPSHTSAARVAGETPFKKALGGYVRQSPVREPEWYAERLARLGFDPVTVIQKVYLHRLPDREQVIEWVRGTLLTAYEKRMPAALWKDFLQRYREVLFAEIPDEKPFLYPFKRLLAWSSRA